MPDFLKNAAFVAILAQGLIGVSLVWDKVLLNNPGTKNLFSYVFWLGSMSVFGVLLVPFGYNSPSIQVAAIAFVTGVIHLGGVFFYYEALKRGEASETLAVMGGFSPVATTLIALALLSKQMSGIQLIGFALMTGGGFVMFFSEKLPLRKLLPAVVLAAGLLGLVNVLEKVVYNQTNFVSGYVWFTIGTFAGALGLLVRPSWRKQIFSESGQDNPRNRFWYFVNRFLSGVGSFLIFYAISLGQPAIVDAISGIRYVIIFVGALLLTKFRPGWLKEQFQGWQFAAKAGATALVIAGLVLVGITHGNEGNSGPVAAVREIRPDTRVDGRALTWGLLAPNQPQPCNPVPQLTRQPAPPRFHLSSASPSNLVPSALRLCASRLCSLLTNPEQSCSLQNLRCVEEMTCMFGPSLRDCFLKSHKGTSCSAFVLVPSDNERI